ncbi:MAG: 30S ribosomal protein S6 [bacterium]
MQENENNDKDITSAPEIGGGDLKVYEVGYLLVPSIPEEEVGAVYGNLKELISSFDGVMISDEMPGMINLAYTMQKTVQNVRSKYSTGYFGWMKFYMSAEKIISLKKKLDLDSKIIRFLVLKTVKENTIAAKRFVHKDIAPRKKAPVVKGAESEEEVEINKEEIDKEIDAMIAA